MFDDEIIDYLSLRDARPWKSSQQCVDATLFDLSLLGSKHRLTAVCRYQKEMSVNTNSAEELVSRLSVSVLSVLEVIIKIYVCTELNHLLLPVPM